MTWAGEEPLLGSRRRIGLEADAKSVCLALGTQVAIAKLPAYFWHPQLSDRTIWSFFSLGY
jgi:hypothetical protein